MARLPLLKKKIQKRSYFKNSTKYHFLQVLVALGGGLSSLAPGMSMGFSAVALPQLRPPDQLSDPPLPHKRTQGYPARFNTTAASENLTLKDDEAAWFTSITMATTPLGCLLSGYLTDKCGRKGALIAVAVPGVIGWLLLATVPTVATATTTVLFQLILGRVLNGVALGMASSPACILAGETSAPCLRGAVLCVNSMEICAGILLVYLLGDVIPGWRMVAAFGAILTGLVALVTLTLPESPVWLRSKGRFGDADWVCSQLGLRTVDRDRDSWNRGNGSAGPSRNAEKNAPSKQSDSVLMTLRLLLEPSTFRPILLLATIFAFQQTSGVLVVTFNAVEVAAWSGIRGVVIDGKMTAVLIGACILIVVVIVCIFIDRWGRRPAMILSGIGMAVSMTALAVYVRFAVQNPKPEVYEHIRPFLTSNYTRFHHSHPIYVSSKVPSEMGTPWHAWVPLVALLSWSASAALGFIPIPWALPAELLPAQARGIGSGILTAMAYTFGFVALRTFSAALLSIALSASLFTMAIFSAAGAAFVAVFLPETRGVAIDGLEERGVNWEEVPLTYTSEDEPTDLTIL